MTQFRCWMLAGRVAALASPMTGRNGRGWRVTLAPPAAHATGDGAASLPRGTFAGGAQPEARADV